jgi:ABC-type polysaccharide/polyol phosphate transport system ATPase subunit
MAGILPPSQGAIAVRGEISTLLSLGVGFNKSLTGRENVYLGGLAAGLQRKEIEGLYDEIVAFSGVGDFIDYPLRTYSSGMAGRLAFAVAVCIEPDILIVDEALSTGDAAFKKKSNERMHKLIHRAGTLIVVSHGLNTILDLSSDCLWLDKGLVMGQGPPEEVIAQYKRFLKVGEHPTTMEEI